MERKEEGKHRPFIAWFLRYICTASSAAWQQPYNVPRPSEPYEIEQVPIIRKTKVDTFKGRQNNVPVLFCKSQPIKLECD